MIFSNKTELRIQFKVNLWQGYGHSSIPSSKRALKRKSPLTSAPTGINLHNSQQKH